MASPRDAKQWHDPSTISINSAKPFFSLHFFFSQTWFHNGEPEPCMSQKENRTMLIQKRLGVDGNYMRDIYGL
jgi:hypothetical protein